MIHGFLWGWIVLCCSGKTMWTQRWLHSCEAAASAPTKRAFIASSRSRIPQQTSNQRSAKRTNDLCVTAAARKTIASSHGIPLSQNRRIAFASGSKLFASKTPSSESSSLPIDSTSLNSAINALSKDENPTLDWKGAARSTSGFVCHFIAAEPTSPLDAIAVTLLEKRRNLTESEISLNANDWEFVMASDLSQAAQDLVKLGSIWYLPNSSIIHEEGDSATSGTAATTTPRAKPLEGEKPRRFTWEQATSVTLQPGDYLRIHFEPRRFKAVHHYDWDTPDNTTNLESGLPGVIVSEDTEKGYIIINKPRNVPVHHTVDNAVENVQACLYRARKERFEREHSKTNSTNENKPLEQQGRDDNPLVYVGTPQRLDQNTSGLLVMATSKPFAAYFAELLRMKTSAMKKEYDGEENSSSIQDRREPHRKGSIHKVYKCLVCVMPPNEYAKNATADLPLSDNEDQRTPWSVGKAAQQLAKATGTVARHYLQPSINAPKRYYATPPAPECVGSQPWLEALLRITSVGPICTLVGNKASEQLATNLWGGQAPNPDERNVTIIGGVPKGCQAVAEVSVELLTGRTHQIRGQMAAMGFPLVGDCQYGGGIPMESEAYTKLGQSIDNDAYYFYSERLALQCSELEFLDPEVVDENSRKKRNSRRKQSGPQYKASDKWNRFVLDRAWWSDYLDEYQATSEQEGEVGATTSIDDSAIGLETMTGSTKEKDGASVDSKEDPGAPRLDLLPDRVQLSPGKNKYVLVRAFYPPSYPLEKDMPRDFWFVKSAAPQECGGPYHGNVAQDLREWIEAAGFEVQVTGGGRIDFAPDQNRCVVYGFSYGFGKGNHDFAASLIQQHLNVPAIADHTEGLY